MRVTTPTRGRRVSLTRSWLVLLLGLAALATAVLAAVSPVDRKGSDLTWDSRTSPNPISVTLMNPVPASIEAAGSLSGRVGPVLETFSGPRDMRNDVRPVSVAVRRDASGIHLELEAPYEGVLARSTPLPAGADASWRLDAAGATIRLTLGDQSTSVTVPEGRRLVLNRLHAGPASDDVQVTITTSGLGLDRPASRHAVLIVVAVLVILAAVLTRLWPLRPYLRVRRLRWTLADTAVILGVAASAVVAVPHYDDGWYLARSRLLVETGWSLSTPLADPFWGGIPNVQGFLYESLLGLTVGQSSLILILRLVPALLMVATWLLLAHRVLPRLLPKHGSGAVWAAAGFFLIWSLGWMTLRPEVLTAFLSVAMLSIFPKRHDPNGAFRVVALAALSALGLATHQSALVLVPILLVAAVVMLFSRAQSWIDKVSAFVLSGALAITMAFANQTLTLAREGLAAYTDLTGHARGPLDEWMRVGEILRIGSMAQRLYFLLGTIAIASLAIVLVRRLLYPRGTPGRDAMLLAVALMPVGLLFTSSKWGWHYGALLLPFALGIVLMMVVLTGAHRAWLARMLIALMFPGLVFVAARPTPVDGPRALAWGALALAIALLLLLVPARMNLTLRGGFVVLSTSTVALGAAAYQALDFHLSSPTGWSFLGQTLGGLANEDARCGLPSYLPAVDPSYANAMDQIRASGGSAAVTPGQYLFSPCVRVWSQGEPGLWSPIPYSIDLPTWSLANLPGVDVPETACVGQPDTGQPGLYPTCFVQLLNPMDPQVGQAPGEPR